MRAVLQRFGRRAGAAVLLAVVLVAGVAPAAMADAVEAGYRDFSFGTSVSAPTAEKPQSKLWFADGSWWGVLFDAGTADHHIHRLDQRTQTWVDSGVLVDPRVRARVDVLVDGGRLYVASAGPLSTDASHSPRVYRFSYDAGTRRYALDSGFPVTLASGGMEALVLDRDSTGRLWVTYTRDAEVYVAHSQGSDTSWTAPYALPFSAATTLTSDDLSTLVAYDGRIGVMWGNQNHGAYYFATHLDGAAGTDWTLGTAMAGQELADDHINLKRVPGDPDIRAVAAVKTSLNAADDPLIYLLVLHADGRWTRHVVGRVADGHTRPIVAVELDARRVHVFATAPCCSGGAIYRKSASLDAPSFGTGVGTPFIKSATDTRINNATSSKQPFTAPTGLVVLAGDDSTDHYLHGSIAPASGRTAPETTIVSGPDPVVSTTTATFAFSADVPATFECQLDGSAFAPCASPATYDGLAPGGHEFAVRATSDGMTDATPATWAWQINATSGAVFSDGFESGDFSAWTNVRAASGATAGVVTSPVHEGAYAARLTADKSYAYVARALATDEASVAVAGWFRVDALSGVIAGSPSLQELRDRAGNRLVAVYRRSDGRIGVRYGSTNVLTASRVPLATWSRLEVRAGTGSSAVIEVFVDGVLAHRATVGMTASVASVRVGGSARHTGIVRADDVTVARW